MLVVAGVTNLASPVFLTSDRAPAPNWAQALSSSVSAMASGQPGWLAAADSDLGRLLSHQGLTASIILAAALVTIALGIYLPLPAVRAVLILAVIAALASLNYALEA